MIQYIIIKLEDIVIKNIEKELEEFKSNYIFKQIEEIDKKQYCEGLSLIDEKGKEINRYGKEYEDLLDKLYVSAIQKPLYRNILKTIDRVILHIMGEKEDIVFNRYEIEFQLNCLKDLKK